jgi:hypothetical protein
MKTPEAPLPMKLTDLTVKSSKIKSRCRVHGTRFKVQGARCKENRKIAFSWFSVDLAPCTVNLPLCTLDRVPCTLPCVPSLDTKPRGT